MPKTDTVFDILVIPHSCVAVTGCMPSFTQHHYIFNISRDTMGQILWSNMKPWASASVWICSEQTEDARMLIKMIAQSADAGPGGWNGLKRKLLHLDIDGSGAVNTDGQTSVANHPA